MVNDDHGHRDRHLPRLKESGFTCGVDHDSPHADTDERPMGQL